MEQPHSTARLLFCVLFFNTCIFSQQQSVIDDETAALASLRKSVPNLFDEQGNPLFSTPTRPLIMDNPYKEEQPISIFDNPGHPTGLTIGIWNHDAHDNIPLLQQALDCSPFSIKQLIHNITVTPNKSSARPTKLLLIGKPGTGKTTLAKAIALVAGYKYYFLEAPFLVNEYKASGIQNLLREIQYVMRQNVKTVIIIDEITELTDRYQKQNNEDSSAACALWLLLDRCAQNPNIFIIGTSNRTQKDLPEQLQSRFDGDIIEMKAPDADARRKMIAFHLHGENCRFKPDFATYMNYLVKKTKGMTNREIEKLINKAILWAKFKYRSTDILPSSSIDYAIKMWPHWWSPKKVFEKYKPQLQALYAATPTILQLIGVCTTLYFSLYPRTAKCVPIGAKNN